MLSSQSEEDKIEFLEKIKHQLEQMVELEASSLSDREKNEYLMKKFEKQCGEMTQDAESLQELMKNIAAYVEMIFF